MKPKRNVIGRWVTVEYKGMEFQGTVVDRVIATKRPKRVRIQDQGPMQGEVLKPSEYSNLVFLPR